MKKSLLPLLLILLATSMKAQQESHFTYSTTFGIGIPLSPPSSTPYAWQVSGHYKLSKRIAAGIGTGLSFYEKTMIPIFADAKYLLTAPRKFVPYLQCSAGYAFAPAKDANGGFFFNPSVGIEYAVRGRIKLLLGIGYEIQKLEQLKKFKNDYYAAEFKEKLNHNSISIRLGFAF